MSERKENSGLIDLDALLAQADAMAPSPQATVAKAEDSLGAVTMELPSAPKQPDLGRVPDVAPASAPALCQPARPTIPATPISKKRADEPPAAPTVRTKRKKAAMIALGVAIVASIATVTVTRRERPAPVTAATTLATATAHVPASAPIVAAAAHAEAAMDPNELPPAAATSTAAANARAMVATPAKKTPAPEPASTIALGEIAAAASDTTGDLGSAMRSAVGARAAKTAKTTEETTAGAAGQVRPSQGAVVGAIATVLPHARACLGPDDAVRSALVVFGSDGTVKAVEIRGAKSEDACVKSALSKARLSPFADDTFATRVTVRPEG